MGSGQWAVDSERRETASGFVRNSAFSIQHSAFTLVELLVTIAIISILAGISLGAMRYARQAAAEATTKATIAKLNDLVMRRYESYITRRVPIDLSALMADTTVTAKAKQAARYRYLALLDLMRMEMPERTYDILYGPLNGPSGSPWTTARPALSQMYLKKDPLNTSVDKNRAAKYLYMWISMTYPEAMEQFGQDEIADIDGDGWPVFIDGWGNPIMFLRWAPGFLPANHSNSDIQTGDAINDHDPFDTQRIFPTFNFRLVPLVYSAGLDKKYGINIVSSTSGVGYFYGIDPSTLQLGDLNPYYTPTGGQAGLPVAEKDGTTNTYLDNITNHRIEQQ